MSRVESASDVTVSVENLGGIEQAEVELAPGVTVLTGRNATNRTSLLRSIMAALGSDDVTLKSDASAGHVSLTFDGETYTRTLERTDGRLVTSGDPYLDDPTVADLFAFLLESNEARRAVRLDADLRDIVMRPVDTDGISREIDRLLAEKREVSDRLDELEGLADELPALERRRTELTEDIEARKDDLARARAALDDLDGSLDASREQRDELEERLDELEDARSALERTRRQLETERESVASLRAEREDLAAEREDLPADPSDRIEAIEAELDRLGEHKRSLDATINQLGQVIQFNESVVDGENRAVVDALADDATDDDGAVTDQLVADDEDVVCWTCGSDVDRDAIDDTLASLRDLRKETVTTRREVTEEMDDLRDERRDLERDLEERTRVTDRLAEIDDEIDRREAAIADLESERDDLVDRVEELEAAVEEREDSTYDEVLERHREVNELEFDLSALESDLEETEAEIERIESELEERESLEQRREEIATSLTDARTRIDRLEERVVETFNEHAAEILTLLEYDNIERIWIERYEAADGAGHGAEADRSFDLHVVRGSESGTTYEDSVEHLSESEREVAGLVFALAGYLAHDVFERVPFIVLDSLEAIDSARIARLVEYFAEYVPYLVVALLEDDAAALADDHARVQMG